MSTSRFVEVHWPSLHRTDPDSLIAQGSRQPEPGRASPKTTQSSAIEISPDSAPAPAELNSPAAGHHPTQESAQYVSAEPTARTEEGAVLQEAQTKDPISTIEMAAPAFAGNGSAQHETGHEDPPNRWTKPKSLAAPLLQELTGLESRCVDLAGRLSEVVQELLSGNVQGAGLASELAVLQADVDSLESRTMKLAVSLSVPAESAAGLSNLGELRSVLKAAIEAEDRRDFRVLHNRATQELEDMLALDYPSGTDPNPLGECQSVGRRLLLEIGEAQWPEVHPDCLALAERRHAYSRLLDLVRERDGLSDDDWQSAEEVVAAAFGKRLAVAAVRGRLRLKNGTAPANESKICVVCGAPLESGAKFCGDCGVKVE